MSQEFKFTDPGEGLHEGEILEVHVSEGDEVEDGDIVLTVETDKASTDVPAPFSGTVEKLHVKEGDMVEVGDTLITYREGGEESEAGEGEEEEKEKEGAGEEEASAQKEQPQEKGGTKEEQRGAEESQQEPAEDKEERQPARRDGKSADEGPVPAAPSTRRLAREKGVDLRTVEASGPHGRVTAEDVEAAAGGGKQRERSGAPAVTPGSAPGPLPDFSQWGEVERTPLRSIRRATAQHMAQSWAQIPHVFHQDVADVTELERFRREYAPEAQAGGGKFTLTVLVMKALVFALKEFPRFNASLDTENEEIVLKRYFHIGMAVATEQGLLVPVARDVDRKNLTELTAEIGALAEQARSGDLQREDMQGASMTVTNPGAMGGSAFMPLVNYPQVAILGMAQARLEPVVRGDLDAHEIVPRLRLPLILGFDHRVNDGADAARFVTTLIEILDDPKSLLLKI